MSAHADDLRFFYSEDIGDSITLTAGSGSSVVTPKLEPGRYILRALAFGAATAVWVRQGLSSVTAAAAVPSTEFLAHALPAELNKPLIYFMVRPGHHEYVAAYGVGAAVTLQITKVSRGKS